MVNQLTILQNKPQILYIIHQQYKDRMNNIQKYKNINYQLNMPINQKHQVKQVFIEQCIIKRKLIDNFRHNKQKDLPIKIV